MKTTVHLTWSDDNLSTFWVAFLFYLSKQPPFFVSATQSTAHNEKHVNNKVTAIDIYLWVCFVFVIFAMIEFALSDFTTHRHLDDMSLTLRASGSTSPSSGAQRTSDSNNCILLVNQNANHPRRQLNSTTNISSKDLSSFSHSSNTTNLHRRRIKNNPIRVSCVWKHDA